MHNEQSKHPEHHDQEEQKGQEDQEEPQDSILDYDDEEPIRSEPMMSAALLIILVTAGLGLIALSPKIDRMVKTIGKSREPIAIGAVTAVRFVDGFGATTQVDTDQGSFLLQGAVSLKAGVQLRSRNTFWGPKVCESRGEPCWDLLSK